MATIIIISFVCPVPPIQGNRLAIYQLVSWLRRRGYKVIFVLQALSLSRQYRSKLQLIVDELIVIDGQILTAAASINNYKIQPIYLLRKFLSKLKENSKQLIPSKIREKIRKLVLQLRANSLPRPRKLQRQLRDCWPETIQAVHDLARRYQPVAAIAEYIYMTPCFEELPKTTLTFIHTHDMLSRIAQDIGVYGVDTQGRECTPEHERNALLKGDIVIALQNREAKLFRELVPERQVIVLGYSPKHIFDQHSNQIIPGRVLMTGGNNPLNRRGLILLCEKVWHTVLQAIPNAQLIAVGAMSNALPADIPNAKALGIIENLEEEYSKAALVVNPVDLGTGLKIKTVEALCYGKALVSTSAGVEGLPKAEEYPCVVADEWQDFANQMIDLLKQDDLRQFFEQKALSYAHEYLAEKYVYAELQQCLKKHELNLQLSN